MRIVLLLILSLSLALAACILPPRPSPEPLNVKLEAIAEKADHPRRAASMRLVDEGRRLLRVSKFARAAHHLSQAIEVDASNPFAYFYFGLVRYQTKKYAQASDLFGRSADLFEELDGWRAEAMAYRGESFEKMKRFGEAETLFDEALHIDARNARARNGLSRVAEMRYEAN